MNSLSIKQKIATIILKLIVIISAFAGILITALSAKEIYIGSSVVFMYFTIQSNIAIALVCLIGLILLFLNKANYIWFVIKLVFTVSITLTGAVYCFVLAPTANNVAWSIQNVLTHVIVPISAIADFFVVCNVIKYRKKDIIYVIIPPLLYAVYASIGYALNWNFGLGTNYPYFFLNWGSKAGAFGFSNKLPYIGVMWWILLLLGSLIGVGYLYNYINNKIRNKLIGK